MQETAGRGMHRSTARALDIVEYVAGRTGDGCTLAQLCAQLCAPKGSLSPIVHTLLDRGWLRVENGRYRTGSVSFEVGQSYLSEFSILEEIERHMRAVTGATGETCHLGTLAGGDVLYLKKIDSPASIRMISMVGSRLPAYGTGLGKALLTGRGEEALRALYPQGLKALTARTVTDFAELARQLAQAEREGFAHECEESNEHIRCIGVPIRGGGQRGVVCALSVATPTFRFDGEKDALIRKALAAAREAVEALPQLGETRFVEDAR